MFKNADGRTCPSIDIRDQSNASIHRFPWTRSTPRPPPAALVAVESALRAENELFVRRVRELHIDAQIDLYSPGTHNWVYWQRELRKAWPLLSDGLHDG